MGLCPCFSVVWLGLEPSSHPFSKIQTRWPRLGTPPCACVGEGGCLVQMLGSWLMGLMTLGNWNYSLWKRKDHLCCSLYTVDLVCSCVNGYLAGMWPGKKYLLALWDEETQHGDRRRLWGGGQDASLPLAEGKDVPSGTWAVHSTPNVSQTWESPSLLVFEPMLIKAF